MPTLTTETPIGEDKNSKSLIPCKDSLFISLSTYPSYQPKDYLKAIDTNFENVKNKRRNSLLEIPDSYKYYEPIHFQMWGQWDLLTLSPVDSSTQITSILQPELTNKDISYNNYRVLSGLCFEGVGLTPNEIKKNSADSFVSLTTVKLSNKWIIGNAAAFFEPVIKKIIEIVDEINKRESDPLNYHISLSYSSYEIIIMAFHSKLDVLSEAINDIRELHSNEIELPQPLESLYGGRTSDSKSNVFSDTNTTFGFRLIRNKDKDHYEAPTNILDTSIELLYELEIKPTHIGNVVADIAPNSDWHLRPGKSDMVIVQQSLEIKKCLSAIILNPTADQKIMLSRIRKIQSILLLKGQVRGNTNEPTLKKPIVIVDFEQLNKDLRTLNISKSIRAQIIKLFLNFKNQINDSLNLNQYLDLLEYVILFRKLLSEKATVRRNFLSGKTIQVPDSVDEIENMCKKRIRAFFDAYLQRHINEHTFEDAPDFLLQSTQFQNIATLYDNYVKFLFGIIRKVDEPPILTTFRNNFTAISDNNLSLSTFNLFEPGTIFILVIKEILNRFTAEPQIKDLIKDGIDIADLTIQYFELNPDSTLRHFSDVVAQFDESYLVNDYLRVKLFFGNDYKLYFWWQRAMTLQQPNLYTGYGELERKMLFAEMFRTYIVAKVLNLNDNDLAFIKNNPPSKETMVDWHKYFEIVEEYFKVTKMDKLLEGYGNLNLIENILNTRLREKKFKTQWSPALKYFTDIYHASVNVSSNEQQVPYLGREWINGKYKKGDSYQGINKNKQPYFLFDPQGGVFFHNYRMMEEYSSKRNKLLYELFLFSCKYKQTIFKEEVKI